MSLFRSVTIIILFLSMTNAQAGSQQPVDNKFTPEQLITFSKDVEKYAASKGARAFIIGRIGRPVEDLPRGINFTHTAIAIYSRILTSDGQTAYGYAIHNLYQDPEDKSRSFLMTDYPIDFYWGTQELRAGIVIPTASVQKALISFIADGKHKQLHNPKYSVLANPYNRRFQNCTEFTLDIINGAIYQTTDLDRLKVNAQAHFDAQRVHTNRFKLAMGSAFMSGLTLNDHKGRVKTATFTSIARYLEEYELLTDAVILTENNKTLELLL